MSSLLAFEGERLEDHVASMLNLYEDLFAGRGWCKVAARRLGVPAEALDLAARVTIVFHDLGKVFYQDRLRAGHGAPLHEYYSLLLLESSRSEVSEALGGERLFDSAEWAIMVHHLSMRTPDLFTSAKGITRYLERLYGRGCEARLEASLTEDLAEALNDIIDRYLGLGRVTPGTYRLAEASRIVKRLLNEGFRIYPLALRLTRVLMVTDNIAAARSRGGKLRVFVRDVPSVDSLRRVREVVESWLSWSCSP